MTRFLIATIAAEYREKAESFKAEINRYDRPTLATELLEQLALTKIPIYTTLV